jgi:hypothetical protein
MSNLSRQLQWPWVEPQIQRLMGPHFIHPMATRQERVALEIETLRVEHNLVRNTATLEEKFALRISLTHEMQSMAIIVPVLSDGSLVALARYRYAARRWSIELPRCEIQANDAGWKQPALEYLLGVAGLNTERLTILGALQIDPATVSTSALIVLAEGCSVTEPKPPNPAELIASSLILNLEEMERLICRGEITCGLTMSALCFYNAWKSRPFTEAPG